MKTKLIVVGKIKEKFIKDGINEYIKRLSSYTSIEVIEINDYKVTVESDSLMEKAKEIEGENILSKIKEKDYVVSLCIEGQKLSSEEFSEKIEDILVTSRKEIAFIIGGSYGLCEKVKKRSDFKLSFSKMTFPHMLMRLILLEQYYRAFKIKNNEKYHK